MENHPPSRETRYGVMSRRSATKTEQTPKRLMPEGVVFPVKELWLNVIAQCSAKYKLRQTCTYFRDLASIANDEIFLQNPLVIKPKLMEQYALYFAELDNIAVICNLLDQGLNPNTTDTHTKSSLLTYGIANEDLAMVDILLKHPLFVIDAHTYSNFNAALKLNYVAIAKRILTTENIDIKKAFGLYFDNATDQNIDILTHFLSMDCHAAFGVPDAAKSYAGLSSQRISLQSLLLRAAKHSHIKIATLLLKHNIDVNCTNDWHGNSNCTPLDSAAENGNLRMLKLLVKHGANLNGNRKDYPPLKRAIYHGKLNSVQFLLNCGASLAVQPSLLACAVTMHKSMYSNKMEIIELLLNTGVDVNEKTLVDDQVVQMGINERGNSALSIATRFGEIEIVAMLLAHPEINVNIKTDNGKTPLDIAIEKRNNNLCCYNCKARGCIDDNYCGHCGISTTVGKYTAIIQLLTEHGGKTSTELAQATQDTQGKL